MEREKLKKINLQLFAEPKVEDEGEKKVEPEVKPEPEKMEQDMTATIEALFTKKFENLEKQMKAQADIYEKKLADAELKIEQAEMAKMNAEQLKEYEKKKESLKAEDEKAELLKQMEEKDRIIAEIKKEADAKAFINKKLIEKSKHPYIAKKIEDCENDMELQLLYKFTDFEKEKALFEADNNVVGSVVNRQGTISKEDAKTSTVSTDTILADVKAYEQELLKQRQSGYYR